MALLLNGIITPEEIGMPVARDPVIAAELISICREVVAQYGPAITSQGIPPDEQRTIMSVLSGIEYFLRRRTKEKVN